MRPPWALKEPLGLHEHAAGTAAWIVDAALNAAGRIGKGLQHFHQHPDHGAGRVEFAAALALGPGKATEEILIDPAQQVTGLGPFGMQGDAGDQIDQL